MSEMDKQKDVREPERFQNGKALAVFLEAVFPLTDKEAEKLFGYLEGQQQLLGQKDGELFRCEQNRGEEMHWKPCSIEDVISDVCEYNYDEILQVTQELMDAGTIKECAKMSDRLNSLCEDEKLLDALFDRTKEGKEIEKFAQILAEELIKNAQSEGQLNKTIQKMTEAMGKGKDRPPESPLEVKRNSGRSR